MPVQVLPGSLVRLIVRLVAIIVTALHNLPALRCLSADEYNTFLRDSVEDILQDPVIFTSEETNVVIERILAIIHIHLKNLGISLDPVTSQYLLQMIPADLDAVSLVQVAAQLAPSLQPGQTTSHGAYLQDMLPVHTLSDLYEHYHAIVQLLNSDFAQLLSGTPVIAGALPPAGPQPPAGTQPPTGAQPPAAAQALVVTQAPAAAQAQINIHSDMTVYQMIQRANDIFRDLQVLAGDCDTAAANSDKEGSEYYQALALQIEQLIIPNQNTLYSEQAVGIYTLLQKLDSDSHAENLDISRLRQDFNAYYDHFGFPPEKLASHASEYDDLVDRAMESIPYVDTGSRTAWEQSTDLALQLALFDLYSSGQVKFANNYRLPDTTDIDVLIEITEQGLQALQDHQLAPALSAFNSVQLKPVSYSLTFRDLEHELVYGHHLSALRLELSDKNGSLAFSSTTPNATNLSYIFVVWRRPKRILKVLQIYGIVYTSEHGIYRFEYFGHRCTILVAPELEGDEFIPLRVLGNEATVKDVADFFQLIADVHNGIESNAQNLTFMGHPVDLKAAHEIEDMLSSIFSTFTKTNHRKTLKELNYMSAEDREVLRDLFNQDMHEDMQRLRAENEQKDAMLEQKDVLIEQKDAMLEQKDTMLEQKDVLIEQKDAMLEQERAANKQKDAMLKQLAARYPDIQAAVQEIIAPPSAGLATI